MAVYFIMYKSKLPTNSRHFCTHLYVFLTVISNIVMEFHNFAIFYYVLWHLGPIVSSAAWRALPWLHFNNQSHLPFFIFLSASSKFASSVREGIDAHFPESSGVTIIAEPGRFYVESAATLVTNVIGIKAGRKRNSRRESTASSVMRRIFQRPGQLQRQTSTIQRRLSRKESISELVFILTFCQICCQVKFSQEDLSW